MHSRKTVPIPDLMSAANMELIRLDFKSSTRSRHSKEFRSLSLIHILVTAADGHSVDEIRTDASGKAELKNLLPGVYEVSEKSVPSPYLKDAPNQLVTLYPNRDRTIYFENHKKQMCIRDRAIAIPFGLVALVGAGTGAALLIKRRHEAAEEDAE